MTDRQTFTRRRFGNNNNQNKNNNQNDSNYNTFKNSSFTEEEPIVNDKQQALKAVNDQLNLIDERYEAINKIASDVIQINELMKDLNTMVIEQGHIIDTIEDNVVQAQNHIEKGTDELRKANISQKKSRGNMFKLGALLGVLGIGIGVGVKVL